LGALVQGMNLTRIDFAEEIERNVKPAMVAVNLAAFRAGMAAVR
jgi:Pyruvate/2-oxoacid:ferredoxin oxidoreductase gamma subunit